MVLHSCPLNPCENYIFRELFFPWIAGIILALKESLDCTTEHTYFPQSMGRGSWDFTLHPAQSMEKIHELNGALAKINCARTSPLALVESLIKTKTTVVLILVLVPTQ